MTPMCETFASSLVKNVRNGKCSTTFTVYEETYYLQAEMTATVLRSDEASITLLLNGLKPHQTLDVLDELVELGMLRKRQPNRYSITSKLFEAIP